MLERQQAQLIAGVQSLYRLNQKGERVPAESLEANRIGQPLVHQILQKLCVLNADDPWDEIEPEILEAEPRTAELDPGSDPVSPPESECLSPSVVNAGSNVTLHSQIDISTTSSLGWGMPSAGNATLGPLAIDPCYQFLNVEGPQSLNQNLPLALDLSNCGLAERTRFGPFATGDSATELFTQPYSNFSVAGPDGFSCSTMDPRASSSFGQPFSGESAADLRGSGTGKFFYM
ncbi:MAG: hypothetical protein Q9216_002297 [Gyalolechia sp. 2 TL-2023]